MASLKDIAKKAGTSIATVSLTLHGDSSERRRVSPEKEALIKRIAGELNYAPNAAARMMLAKKSGQIGVVVRNAPDRPMHNPPNYEIILGLSDVLADAGYLPVIIPLKIAGGELDDLRVFKERLLDGIVFTDCVPQDVFESIAKLHSACIFVESEWRDYNCLRRSDLGSGEMAARHLEAAGCRKIVYFGLDRRVASTHFSIKERAEGVQRRCAEAKLGFEEIFMERIAEGHAIPQGSPPLAFHQEFLDRVKAKAGLLAAGAVSGEKLGIVAYNSILAHAVYASMADRGLAAGRDYALCSCDSCFEMELNWPELACCQFNRYEAGKAAARMMLAMLGGEGPQKSLSLAPAWKDGETARCLNAAKHTDKAKTGGL